MFGFGKSFVSVSKFFLKSWRGSRLACRLASAGLAGWLGLAGLPGLLAGCSGAAVRLWRRCCGARGLSFWLLICGGVAAVVRRVPLSGARSPRGWVAGSRLRFVFCVLGFAGFLCGFRFRSFAFLLSKNAVFGRFWVRALSNLCRRLAAADFSLCAPRFCACVRVLRLRVLSDFLSFRKIIFCRAARGSNFFLVFGPWWRGARRVFEFFRMGLQAPPCAVRVRVPCAVLLPCCVVLLCVVVCWCVCGGWCGFV